jgi:hypothetical protein
MVSRIAARLLPFALLLGACAEESAPLPPLPVYPASAPMVLKLEGATACDIDADCDDDTFCFLSHCAVQCVSGAECDSGVCDDRGRCTESNNKAAGGDLPAGPPNNRILGIVITERPELEIQVSPGEEFVTVTFETSESVTPQGGLSYRIESSADDSLARRVQTSNGGTTHTVVIPTAAANPAFTGDAVDISIVTPIGTIPLILKSVLTVAGIYEGMLKLDGLGTEIPLKVGVDGDMGALGTGVSNAFLVVPSGEAAMFGPVAESQLPADNATKELRAPLEYDSAIEAWVATFSNAYDIPSTQAFGDLAATQVKRELRYELKVEADRTISGTLVDRWLGLYDATQSDGTRVIPEVQIGGNFRFTKSADQPATNATNFLPILNAPNPQLQNFSLSTECTTLADATDGCAARTTFAGALACSDAVGGGAVKTKTLTEVVAGLLEGGLTDDGKTFEKFLAGCADGSVAACVPTKAQRCGIELQAVAFGLALPGYSLDKERLWNGFGNLLLEVTGGPQLGAFFVDTKSRRKWLENANYGSTAITSAAAAQLNAQLMDDYVTKVLGPNIEALRTYLKPSSFAFLSRVPDSADSIDQRDRLLIAMVGSWTATADSLSLAAQRWNEVYRLDSERRIKAKKVAGYLGEMYRAAAVIIQLHKEAGKAAEAAPVAAGLNTLLLRYEALTNTFNELLFARDGELAVSSSLDPEQASRGVLAQRREAALKAVNDASTKVDTLLQTLLSNDIRNADLFKGLDDSVNESQKRLAELCGQPDLCDPLLPDDAANPLCDTSWVAGVCGFKQSRSPLTSRTPRTVEGYEDINAKPSEAGLAIYGYGGAGGKLKAAISNFQRKQNYFLASQAQTVAFKAQLESRYSSQKANIKATKDNFDGYYETIKSHEDEQIRVLTGAIDAEAIKMTAKTVNTAAQIGFAVTKASAIVADAGTTLVQERVGFTFQKAGTKVKDIGEKASDCPDVISGVAIRLGIVKCAGNISSFSASTAITTTADVLAGAGQISHTASVAAQAWKDAYSTIGLFASDLAVQMADSGNRIRELRQGISTANDESSRLKIENEMRFLDANFENETRYKDDLLVYAAMMMADGQLSLDKDEAKVQEIDMRGEVIRAQAVYLQTVESARQERASLVLHRLQRRQISQLVAGPQAVFFAANGLTEAERELDRAKRKMNDWLVALEYAAVRPFYNERMSILLARNTYQLRAIADRLTDLEGKCGGASNLQDGSVSLRTDLLKLTTSQVDPVSGQTLTPAARFRQTLAQSDLPATATMRYTVSQTVDQVAANSALLVVNFNLGLTQFANLPLTCNAKLASIGLKLVGDNLGEGQPAVTLLYGGNSQTYSCQPGIDSYVQTFGQGDTTFGSTTSFVVNGRSASPVAGVGEMGSRNVTFAGLPLAGDYTLIIDPTVPANQAINWNNLDDIKLGLTFSYQDIFSSSSDCANSL